MSASKRDKHRKRGRSWKMSILTSDTFIFAWKQHSLKWTLCKSNEQNDEMNYVNEWKWKNGTQCQQGCIADWLAREFGRCPEWLAYSRSSPVGEATEGIEGFVGLDGTRSELWIDSTHTQQSTHLPTALPHAKGYCLLLKLLVTSRPADQTARMSASNPPPFLPVACQSGPVALLVRRSTRHRELFS